MDDIIELYIGKENVKTIVEAGACDCSDSVAMTMVYPNAHVYAFECNPETLPLCRERKSDRITLWEVALSDDDGFAMFYPIDTEKTITPHTNGNPGASSFYKANTEYPNETYVQKEVRVPIARLDTIMMLENFKDVDFMWLDAQGSELQILKGMGNRLKDVKIIKTEVLFKEQYLGAPLFDEVEEWLDEHGFRFVRFLDKYEWFGDAIFVNKSL